MPKGCGAFKLLIAGLPCPLSSPSVGLRATWQAEQAQHEPSTDSGFPGRLPPGLSTGKRKSLQKPSVLNLESFIPPGKAFKHRRRTWFWVTVCCFTLWRLRLTQFCGASTLIAPILRCLEASVSWKDAPVRSGHIIWPWAVKEQIVELPLEYRSLELQAASAEPASICPQHDILASYEAVKWK